jgi:cyclic pyranopterin phosphate synthase
MDTKFSHIDDKEMPSMVDVGYKKDSERYAHAECIVEIPPVLFEKLIDGDIYSKKGPVFQTAIIAGTMAVKKTSDLIPLCHPLSITDCKIEINPLSDSKIVIDCRVKIIGKTGVEMEALTGASVAALTVYDMCKAITQDIVIQRLHLVEKTGGKKNFKRRV